MDGTLLAPQILRAATTESISGTVLDPTGATFPGGTLTATNTSTGVEPTTTTNDQGLFAFPSLPVGRYELKVESEGSSPHKLTGLVVDADSALQAGTTLTMTGKIEQVTVLANEVRVETSSTPVAEVTAKAITAVAPHGRSFTGLLALQPGIVPMTVEQPAIAPSGVLNPRNQSISGRRADAQGCSISGATRASTRFPATISSDADDSPMASVPNGVNNHSLDLPDYTPGWLNLNLNPRPGTASRRSFPGPGMVKIAEVKALHSAARILQHLQPRAVFWTGDAGWRCGQQTVRPGGESRIAGPVQVALKFTF